MKIKSVRFIGALKASFEALSTSTSIATLNRIVSEAQQGNFVLFAKYFDRFNVVDGSGAEDGAVFTFFKTLTDDTGIAEAATTQFTKALNDIGVFSDDELFAMAKSLTDAASVSETHSNALQKPVSDDVASAEDETLVFAKKVSEDTASSVDQINTLAVGKPLADTSPVSDAYAALTDKPLPDDASTSDDELLASSKALQDYVNVSDDVDGAASILDDQELSVFKQMTKVARASEQFTRQVDFIRYFTDIYTVTDTPSLGVGRPASDAATVNADLFEPVFTKTNLDNIVLTESLVVGSVKLLYDNSSAADQKSLQVSTPHSDPSVVSDVEFLAPNKVLTELAATTDAGSLKSQGYSDLTYFAEDYVGASRTF